MPRWRHAFISLITLPLLVSCGGQLPGDADGDLADDWATLAAPTRYEPKVGACLSLVPDIVTVHHQQTSIVDCSTPHEGQIVATGTYPPEGWSFEADRAALATCDEQATALLKEDWRNGKLVLNLLKPQSASAPGGDRWWECVMTAVDPERYTYLHQELNRDFAAGIPAPQRYSCQRTEFVNGRTEIENVECSALHDAEYVGSVALPSGTPFPVTAGQWERIHLGCQAAVARYVGVVPMAGQLYGTPIRSAQEWPDWRDVRCFVFFGPNTMTGSAKDTNGVGIPW